MGFYTDRVLPLRVEDYQVGIAADRHRPFLRIKPEDPRRRGRDQLDKAVHAEAAFGYAAGINKAHPVLDAGAAIGDLGEVIFAKFFLLLEAERTVIGGDHLKMILFQSSPWFCLVPLLAQQCSEYVSWP